MRLAANDARQGYRSSLPIEGTLPSLDGAVQWLNSEPLTAEQLRGKVVLVDFWTYSCINCIRTVPYVRAWAEKYKDQGLVVIGVHAPEFAFEKRIHNVERAIRNFGITYPVAVDNDFKIWRAFGNSYWPAHYFIDAEGRIRHHHFGEGDYEESEQVIQELLAEAKGGRRTAVGFVAPDAQGAEAAPDLARARSGETYVGYQRASSFASPETMGADEARDYTVGRLRLNQWGLAGNWTVGAEQAGSTRPEGQSPTGSGRGTCISFSAPARTASRCGSRSPSTAKPRERTVAPTLTPPATGQSRKPGSTSWFASPEMCGSGHSKSASWMPASRPTCSRSAKEKTQC